MCWIIQRVSYEFQYYSHNNDIIILIENIFHIRL